MTGRPRTSLGDIIPTAFGRQPGPLARVALLALGACALALGMANAGETDAVEGRRERGGKLGSACQADLEKLCPDVEAGRVRVECLWNHQDDLSSECRALIEEKREGARAHEGSCREEMRALCPDASGRDEMRQCMSEKREELSEECRQRLDRFRDGGRGRPGGSSGGRGRGGF